jgi:hypothetical protein
MEFPSAYCVPVGVEPDASLKGSGSSFASHIVCAADRWLIARSLKQSKGRHQ